MRLGGERAADEDTDDVRAARGVLRAGADAERLGDQHRLRPGGGGEAAQEGDAGGGGELADAGGDTGGDAPAAVLVRAALGVGGQGCVGVGDRVVRVWVGMAVVLPAVCAVMLAVAVHVRVGVRVAEIVTV